MKKKIVYVISSLKKSGPVNVLYNLISNIDKNEYEITVVTIKTCVERDMTDSFKHEGARCLSLDLNFEQTIRKGRNRLESLLKMMNPDIVHAQCFRSAILISCICGSWRTCATIHCYPHKVFVNEYGCLIGKIMTQLYIRALKKVDMPIACSRSIAEELERKYSLNTRVVLNGVARKVTNEVDLSKFRRNSGQLIYLCVAEFNTIKNQKQLLLSTKKVLESNKIAIIFLGDGKYRKECENLQISNTYFLGNVDNVNDYYAVVDGMISASKSEGLPMAVLEALVMGVPRYILSDIPPHREIATMFPEEIKIVNYNGFLDNEIVAGVDQRKRCIIMKKAEEQLSAYNMVKGNCEAYESIIS
ncbi:glycosyltransferase [Selenomonas ruminantium]|uniref:Glycosyltransferase involved in cell wall bisynthesis n=1 Tax=Selenomonas ruminantium TaxID=971 RepID=A0A1K1NN65_SELRU|nr:glycosyltransferase [Selenomonas ruminantium]SFW36888.1 Glycosyltransferase involved in cell wall bisynthesis [Selenomonas ruminantium]